MYFPLYKQVVLSEETVFNEGDGDTDPQALHYGIPCLSPSHVYCGRVRDIFFVCPPLTCIVDGYELFSLSVPLSRVLWTGTSYFPCLSPLSRVLWTGTSYIPCLSPSHVYCGRLRVIFLVCPPSHVYCGRVRVIFLVCPPLTCIVDGYELRSLSVPSHVYC